MSPIRNIRSVYATLLTGLVIIVVGAIIVNGAQKQKTDDGTVVSPAPSASITPSPTESTVEPVASVSPSPSVTPVATASPLASPVALPQSVVTFLSNFYTAYAQSDRSKLETFFTVDTTDTQKSRHSQLFKGLNLDGTPGGPTLFSTSTADQRVTAYTVTTSTQTNDSWKVTVQEQRVNGGGTALGPNTATLMLVPSGSTWLIDSYVRSGGTAGKYDGFLSE